MTTKNLDTDVLYTLELRGKGSLYLDLEYFVSEIPFVQGTTGIT